MNYITQLIDRIKKYINTWIDKRLLSIKINKFHIGEDDTIFVRINSQFVRQDEVMHFKNTLDAIDVLKNNYVIIYNGFVNEVDKLTLGEKDVVLAKIPLETFYLWDRSDELQEKSSIIKQQFKESGVNNKLVVLPDGYEYKKEDYLTILNKINQNNANSEIIR